jgi:hypothetical protein
MNKEDKYLKEDKYRVEIRTGVYPKNSNPDDWKWMSIDKAGFDKMGKRYSRSEAEKMIKKVIKAGRAKHTIRMVKENFNELDILDRLEIETLIRETEEFLDDDELSEAAIAAAGWGKKSVEKFGETIGKSPDEKGFFDTCVVRMKGKKGFDGEKAEKFCASLIDTYKGTTKWRGEGH